MADLGNLELKVIVDTVDLVEAEKQSDKTKKATDELGQAYDENARKAGTLRAAQQKYAQTLSKLDEELRQGKISTDRYAKSVALLDARYDAFNKQTGKAGATAAQFRSQIQQASFQVGDFFTQIASGGSGLVAFTQQFSQFAGAFGAAGAAVGAVTAILGAAAISFVDSLEESEKSANGLRSEVDLLRDAVLGLEQARRQLAAEDPINIAGNIEAQRRDLEQLLALINGAVEEGQVERVFAGPSTTLGGVQASEIENILGLLEKINEARQLEGEQALEIDETYLTQAALSSDLVDLRGKLIGIARELAQSESDVADEIAKQATEASEAEASAQQRLSTINAQLTAIQSGTSAIEAQSDAARELAIAQLKSRGVSEETATALIDQQQALKDAAEAEKERLANIETRITAQQKETDFLGQYLAQQERVAQAEAARIASAQANAANQLTVLRAQSKAIEEGKDTTEAAFTAQQKLYRAQLLSKGVATETVDEIIRLNREVRAAGQQAGDDLAAGFESAGESIAASVTDAVISGDWDNTGQQIGSVLGAAIGTAVAGPVGGAIGGAIAGSLLRNDFTYTDPTQGRQSTQNTGEILGGIDDKSQSIADATKATADALTELIGVNRALLAAQQGADESIGKFAAEAARSLEVLEGLPGISDVGIDFTGGQPSVFASGGGFTGQVTAAIGQDLANQLAQLSGPFDEALNGVGDVLTESARTLGIELSGEFDRALLDIGKVSLEGLSSEEFAEVISQTFGTALNQASNQLVPDIQSFVNEVGESSGQIIVDFARNATVVDGALSGLNSSLSTLTGLDLGQVSTDLVELFGDSGALVSATKSIFDTFATEEQKSEQNIAGLVAEFDALGRSIPQTRRELLEYVQGLDLQTEAGREALAAVARSTDELDQLYTEQEDRVKEFADNAAAAFDALTSTTDAALAALRASIDAEQAQIKDTLSDRLDAIKAQESAALEANKSQISAAKELASAISSEVKGIESALRSLRGSSSALVEQDRQQAFIALQAALQSGDLTGAGDAASAASKFDEGLFSSSIELNRQQGRTIGLLTQLEKEGGQQLTAAELQLDAVQKQTTAIKRGFDDMEDAARAAAESQISALEGLYEREERSIAAIRGLEEPLMSIKDAIDAMNAAIVAELAGSNQGEQPATMEQVEDAFIRLLGREIGDEGREYFGERIAAGDTLADITYIIRNSPEFASTLPGFANGGYHDGGMRLVGERGPELELTGPSRIVSNSDLRGMMGSGTEIASLRDTMRASAVQQIKLLQKMYRKLDDWDTNGQPETRFGG